MCKTIGAARELTLAPVKQCKISVKSCLQEAENRDVTWHPDKYFHYPSDTVGIFSKDLHVGMTGSIYLSLKAAVLFLTGSPSKAVLLDILPNFLQ